MKSIYLIPLVFVILLNCGFAQEDKTTDSNKSKRTEAIENIKKIINDKSGKLVLNKDNSNPYITGVICHDGTQGEVLLSYLRLFPDINSLSLFNTNISLKGAESLQYLTNIKAMIIESSNFTDDKIRYINKLVHLEDLDITRTNITSDGLKEIVNMKDLKTLVLYYTNVGDEGMKYISELPNLELLLLQHTKITDKGLVHLQGMKKLRSLALSGTAVTVDGLLSMKDLPSLQYMELGATEYSSMTKWVNGGYPLPYNKAKANDYPKNNEEANANKKDIGSKLKKNFPSLLKIEERDMLNLPLYDLPGPRR